MDAERIAAGSGVTPRGPNALLYSRTGVEPGSPGACDLTLITPRRPLICHYAAITCSSASRRTVSTSSMAALNSQHMRSLACEVYVADIHKEPSWDNYRAASRLSGSSRLETTFFHVRGQNFRHLRDSLP